MQIEVKRFSENADATLSSVCIDGAFSCFGLEDEYRESKVSGETRIPAGTYKVGLRKVGGFHGRYGRKFPRMHRGMLQVLAVPGFEYILIHIGNTDEDTAGCLLVGEGASTGDELRITHSTNAYKRMYSKVIDAAERGELSIAYLDNTSMHL